MVSIFSIFPILLLRSKYEKLEGNTSLMLNSVCYSAPNTITKKNDLKSVMKDFDFI